MAIINHVGISGGKDSGALMLWALHESGYCRSTLDFTFCDTDNEHDLTYDTVVRYSEHSVAHGGPPIRWLKPPLGFYELARKKHRFPGVKSRFCTQELKIFPTQRHVKKLIAEGHYVVMHSGVRAAESDARAKMVPREEVDEHHCQFRPMLRWPVEQVWDIHRRYLVEPNPLYGMGAKRVGCLPCIMSRKAEIANIAQRFPDTINHIREQEGDWRGDGYFHGFFCRDKVPMRFRSKKIRLRDGSYVAVCTIDDVVRWATEKPHVQIDFNMEFDTKVDDRDLCDLNFGHCE